MCGILGYLNKNIDTDFFKKALNTMSHRGPDGFGIWQEDTTQLGHRRLAIIDISDEAKQPMTLEKRYTITFNGEIYNYLEIKKELQTKGVKFTNNSDTEVLLQSYIMWGPDCLNKLNGMWAFAVWDNLKKELFLSRDRLGKKPLFYSITPEFFAFSSEMKGLYPFLSNLEINYELAAIAANNSFSYEHTEHCLIKGIKRFPAASFGYYSKEKGLVITPFWKPEANKIELSSNYDDQKEQFRELFFDACMIRMRSDVTIGTALSGGLDSSAVICSMAHLNKNQAKNIQKDWQHAFIASFPGTNLDESEYAKTVTDYLGINAHFLNIDPIKDLENIFYQTYLFEEIYYAPLMPFVQLYENIKRNKVTVSIDGHGADELFAGYPFDLDAALIDALPSMNQFNEILASINAISGLEKNHEHKNKLKFALINKYPIIKIFAKNPNMIKKFNGLDYLNSRLFQSSFKTTLPTLLRNYDRYSMINGVEIRMPFLDHRIVDFAFSIPYSSKIRGGYSKAIIRDALSDIMPTEIAYRKNKIGFNAPIHNWMSGELKNWINDLIHSNDFNNATTIDRNETFKSVSEALNKSNQSFLNSSKIFEKLMPFIWEKSIRYAKQ